jgi:hypothetical protein
MEHVDCMLTLGEGGPPDWISAAPSLTLTYKEITDGELSGQGGNADVYRVLVDHGDRTVPGAVKQPRLGGTLHSDTVDRFVEEAEVWDQLDGHDHVVTLFVWGCVTVTESSMIQ